MGDVWKRNTIDDKQRGFLVVILNGNVPYIWLYGTLSECRKQNVFITLYNMFVNDYKHYKYFTIATYLEKFVVMYD